MRHSKITKVYFGASRAYRYIDCKRTRTRTRETRAHAHERKQSMYQIATQERTQSMYRIATQERTQSMYRIATQERTQNMPLWIIYKRNAIIANMLIIAYIVHLYNAK